MILHTIEMFKVVSNMSWAPVLNSIICDIYWYQALYHSRVRSFLIYIFITEHSVVSLVGLKFHRIDFQLLSRFVKSYTCLSIFEKIMKEQGFLESRSENKKWHSLCSLTNHRKNLAMLTDRNGSGVLAIRLQAGNL